MNKFLFFLFPFIVGVAVIAGIAGAQTFQGPCGNPPSGNCGILFSSSTRALQIGTSTVYSTQSQLLFQTSGGSNQHILFFPNGNVGIGTLTPAQALQVNGNIQASSFLGAFSGALAADNVSSGVFGLLQAGGNFAFPASLGIATSSKTGLPQPLAVYGNAYVRDNVGIGTIAPAYPLDVNGAARVNGQLYVMNDAQVSGRLWVGTSTATLGQWIQSHDQAGDRLYMGFVGDATKSGSIQFYPNGTSNGQTVYFYPTYSYFATDVRVGSAGVPVTTLDVVGDLSASATSTFAANVCIGGVCRNAWPAGSVTSVGSGAGLSGGPITTSGTLTLNMLGGTCGGNQKISSLSSTGTIVCSNDIDTVGVTNVTATGPLTSTGGATPNISVPQANGTTNGYLASGDWTTFNNKGNGTVTGAGTANYIPYWTSATALSGTSPFVVSGSNVGLGTTTPLYPLSVAGAADPLFGLFRSTAVNPVVFKEGTDSAFVMNVAGSDLLTLKNGFVGVGNGNTNPGYPLDVAGDAEISGRLWVGTSTATLGQWIQSQDLALDRFYMGFSGGVTQSGSIQFYPNSTASGPTVLFYPTETRFGTGVRVGSTVAPVRTLDVTGDLAVSATSTFGANVCIGGVCQSTWPSGVLGSGTANYFTFWQNASTVTSTSLLQINGGSINVTGPLQMSGTQFMDTSRNLSNIGTIASGNIMVGGSLQITNTNINETSGGAALKITTAGGDISWDQNGGLGPTRLLIQSSTGNVVIPGQVQIQGGIPGAGKVLTSDANGVASWATPTGSGGSSDWVRSGNNLYPTSTTDNVAIGATTPLAAKFAVVGTAGTGIFTVDDNASGGMVSIGSNNSGETHLTMGGSGSMDGQAGQLQIRGGGITVPIAFYTSSTLRAIFDTSGNMGIGVATPSSKLEVLTTSPTDEVLRLSRTATATSTKFRVGLDGILVIQNQASDAIFVRGTNVGIGVSPSSYRFTVGSTNSPQGFAMAYFSEGTQASTGETYAVRALHSGGALSNRTAYGVAGESTGAGGGANIGGYFTASGNTINYGIRIAGMTAGANNYALYSGTAGVQSYFAGNVGIGTSTPTALLSVGTTTTGLVAVFGGGTGKISVGTWDPVYTIGGKGYATYGAAMTGQKEETSGIAHLTKQGGRYSAIVDFKNAEEASDLWLFAKVTNLVKHFDGMTILLTPAFDGNVWYEKDAATMRVMIYGSSEGEVSYRLTAPRFDAETLGNRRSDNVEGFNLDKLIK